MTPVTASVVSVNRQEVVRIPGTDLPLVTSVPFTAQHAELVHAWASAQHAQDWIDMGNGKRDLTCREFYCFLNSSRNHARVFLDPGTLQPTGLACLNDVHNQMGYAEIWGLRGQFTSRIRGLAPATSLLMLATAFIDFERESVGAWVVAGNSFAIALHQRLGYVRTGVQRRRHRVGQVWHDRVTFDITREEFATRYPRVPAASGRCWLDRPSRPGPSA